MNKIPENIKFIYFVGIKGVGMASLAVIASEAGIVVRGSDLPQQFITDSELLKNKIKVDSGFERQLIDEFLSDKSQSNTIVIVTAAHGGLSNPQADFARERGFVVLTHGQAVGEFMKGRIFGRDFEGISVAGSHGKTTTTAMIATYLSILGRNPSYTIGTSTISYINSSNRLELTYAAGRYGQGDYFIAEADEYVSDLTTDRTPKLLYQTPFYAVINNIDFDHPDYYKDIEQIKEVYVSFVKKIKKKGALIINGDDPYASYVISHAPRDVAVITYGNEKKNSFQVRSFVQLGEKSHFCIYKDNIFFSKAELSVPGEHNAVNCLSAVALLDFLGYSSSAIEAVLPSFLGVERRIQKVGNTKYGALIIDDYAHHPREVVVTLNAIKAAYPEKKIVCIFQPHTYSRFEKLIKDFSTSFLRASYLILLPIYGSARESYSREEHIDLQEKFQKLVPTSLMLDETQVVEYVNKHFRSNDFLVVTMGAGDVYKISQKLKVSGA